MITILVLTVVWLALSLALTDATESLNTALLIMLYLLVPWTAVNLTDYFFVRRGHYVIADLFTPAGVYGRWPWRGIGAFLIGIAAEIPFMDLPFFVGPAASAMGEVDIAFVVGLVVSGGAYVLFTRTQDLSAETRLLTGHPELSDPAGTGEIRTEIAAEEHSMEENS